MPIRTKTVVKKVALTEAEKQAVNIVLKVLDEINLKTDKHSCDCCPMKKLCNDEYGAKCLLPLCKKSLQKLL